jgi:hypothetical protein
LPQVAASSQSQALAPAQPAQNKPVGQPSTSEDGEFEVRTLTLTMKELDEGAPGGDLQISNDGKDVQMQEEDFATN